MEYVVVAVLLLSCVRLFATTQTTAHQAFLSFTISQSLLKLMSSEAVMPSNHPILCCPLLLLSLIFPSSSVFFNESALHIRWPKYWSFTFSTSPSSDGVCGHMFIRRGRVNIFDLIVPYPQDYLQFQPCLFIWPGCTAFRILVPLLGNEPEPLSMKVKTPNHWTIREFPPSSF